jgi:transcriptional regulator with XRE-family HTH domain
MTAGFNGKALAQIRRDKGMLQFRFASLLGVSRQVVGEWERGIKVPNHQNMARIADILECSLDDLFTRADARVRP